MRQILIIVASVVFLGGIFVALWFIFGPKEATLDVSDTPTFGTAGDAPIPTGDTGTIGSEPIPAGQAFTIALIKITDSVVASGMAAIALPPAAEGEARGEVEIRYIDRASGNVFAYKFHERTLARISNRTLPGIQDAVWLSDGSQAFVRYLANSDDQEVVETYALPVGEGGGFFLERNLGQVAVSGTTTVFTLLPSTNGSIGTAANVDGTNSRTIFSSSIASLVAHLSNGPYIVATKPSVMMDGYAFTVGAGGRFTRILGPYRSLSVLPSPSGNLVAFSYVENRALKMSVLDRRTGEIIALPVATMVEKCVWANGEEVFYCGIPKRLPTSERITDDWYQGVVSFTDRIWEINLVDRLSIYLIDPQTEAEVELDITNLAIDGRNDVLTFKNKKDGSLWAYDL